MLLTGWGFACDARQPLCGEGRAAAAFWSSLSGQFLPSNVLEIFQRKVPILEYCWPGVLVTAQGLSHRPDLFLIPQGSGVRRESQWWQGDMVVSSENSRAFPERCREAGVQGSVGGGAPQRVTDRIRTRT